MYYVRILLQISRLTNKSKFKLLGALVLVGLVVLIPITSENFTDENKIHISIHISSTLLGVFLSIVALVTYFEFKTTRLFLVLCAFTTITAVEIFSIISFVLSEIPPTPDSDSLVTHGLIFAMLSFFAIGIFRSD
ncbi:hypothetical protein AAA799E16_01688 [Marine Group I thaumarchaeote SCGC AAA799-E16]|uniref:Uncharacterized protein n=5 Tax=Marine Group I TaxID=905826 RepID=A0A087S3F3_9ARCH|nr:hypothetical protein AAA799N04_01591 [Marine Group I thaumarchaeote SCGC AAA799-N04]KER05654.1 hypothetical protein AAA799E16_01688 [Marine Group I thaumarchaeote SCGC AAA799-E16]KFM16179.1 hypothetical protein AAA799D11_00988 [Marine Group I thaumarchaeote SCGC AAA799-D11]KFM16266.1 hypothetical protein SCCGRSA3_02409 [Marine Group I thaumarchaeote SCGC RSA3]KFM20257.1 hypothetical protein AAA799P11_00004 [Marine Group I thaumarchaeote SCGC AAA799-P11]